MILLYLGASFLIAGWLAWRIRRAQLMSLDLEEEHLEAERTRALNDAAYSKASDLARKLHTIRSERGAMLGEVDERAASGSLPEAEPDSVSRDSVARLRMKSRRRR